MPISSTYRPALVTGCAQLVSLDGWAAGMLGPGVIDAAGILWTAQLSGWSGAPAVRTAFADRPSTHGDFDSAVYLSDRVITITGYAVAPDQPTARLARDIVSSVLGDPLMVGTLVVTEPGQPTRQCAVRRSDPTVTNTQSPTHFQYQILLTAVDPRRYDVNVTSTSVGLPGAGSGGLVFPLVFPLVFGTGTTGGSMTLTNTGTIQTWPMIDILGPVTGPTITNNTSSQSLVFGSGMVVAAGHHLLIDNNYRTVTMDGINRRNLLFTAQWWDLDPGANVISWSQIGSYDPAAQLTVSYRNAWT